ncbi:nucleolar protein,Nop52-domain-containing protein [Dipodascopsis tothii]|uniref:nucleolar protein,Nop52-domain-containing protein n=1 Tax=Dipodascopsis tothii TaxID=44089 RepID=UPI0034CDA3A6
MSNERVDETIRSLVKRLSANDRPTRDDAVVNLSEFLKSSGPLVEIDLLKICKGLYFCMWMSDRPRTQQRLANDIAELLVIVEEDNLLALIRAVWETLCREWSSIDVLRIDKYYLLIRRIVAASFRRLEKMSWKASAVSKYSQILSEFPLHPTNLRVPDGIRYHLVDIYVDELEKVVVESHSSKRNTAIPVDGLLAPFERIAVLGISKVVRKRVVEEVLADPRLAKLGYQVPDLRKLKDTFVRPHSAEATSDAEEETPDQPSPAKRQRLSKPSRSGKLSKATSMANLKSPRASRALAVDDAEWNGFSD